MLGAAPGYEVIRFQRPDVLCHSTFKRALFSVRAAWEESQIKARFEDDCVLILHDGRRIPFYQYNNTYVLPRWTNEADAKAARAILTSPDRSVPRGDSETHDEWISAALRQEHMAAYDVVQEFMKDDDELHATSHHSPDATTHKTHDRIRLLHCRLGHLAPQAMEKLPRAALGAGELANFTREQIERAVGNACDVCAQSRMLRRAHQKAANRKVSTTDPVKGFGDCVSTDNAGPLTASFVGGFRYLTVFVDHFTSLISAYFQRTKGLQEAIPIRERYIADHAVYGRVKRFHSDSAGELMGETMQRAMHQHQCGTTHNVAGESDMNNRAEAAIHLIFSMARAMRLHSGVPQSHWPVITLYAAYVRNRLPLRSKRDGSYTTRLALARGGQHTIAELRVFGCVCHGLIQKKDREGKLSAVARTGIFMGFPRYQQGGAAYVWEPNNPQRKYLTIYSVRFDEGRTYKDAWKLTSTLDDETTSAHRRLILQRQHDTHPQVGGAENSNNMRNEEQDTGHPSDVPSKQAIKPLPPPPKSGGPRTPRSHSTQLQRAGSNGEDCGEATNDEQPLPKGACGKVNPDEPKLPTWTTRGRCRLPNGHLGSCDWEIIKDTTHDMLSDDDEFDQPTHDGTDYDFHMTFTHDHVQHWSQRVHAPYTSPRSLHALLLFSGECRSGSLAAHLRQLGWQVTAIDQKIGGRRHDLTNERTVDELASKISAGSFDYVFASPPANLSPSPRHTQDPHSERNLIRRA